MMDRLLKILIFLLLTNNICFAGPNSPFSQLEFDQREYEKAKNKQPRKDSNRLKFILSDDAKLISDIEMRKKQEPPKAVPVESQPNEEELVAKAFDHKKVKLADEISFLAPSLRGPIVDSGREHQVTSSTGWDFRDAAYCELPLKVGNMCRKSRALEEVLSRFTGERNYFQSECADACSAGYIRVPTNVEIYEGSAGLLRVDTIVSKCHYIVEKKKNARWRAIRVKELTCSCLPTSCFAR